MAKTDLSNNYAFSHYGPGDHYSIKAGQVLYIQKCVPVEVEVVALPKCYEELTVKYNGKDKFMIPDSQILVDIGHEIECSNIVPPQFLIEGKWYTKWGETMIYSKEDPVQMSIEPSHDFEFSYKNQIDKEIYYKNDYEQMRSTMFNYIHKYAKLNSQDFQSQI